jgi:hypothetical protein
LAPIRIPHPAALLRLVRALEVKAVAFVGLVGASRERRCNGA